MFILTFELQSAFTRDSYRSCAQIFAPRINPLGSSLTKATKLRWSQNKITTRYVVLQIKKTWQLYAKYFFAYIY